MRLEIRDLEDQTVYDIGPEGAVLGRERAKTDISLRDESISKRHARIFLDDGQWFLEDLNSSNGTYVDDQRISSPVMVTSGMAFSLAQRRFEVVFMDGVGASAPLDDFPPPGMRYGGGRQEETGGDMPPLPGMESQAYVEAHGSEGNVGGDDEAGNSGIKYFMVAVPKAVAFYMVQVPLMGLNPIGVIRKGIEEQPRPVLSKMEVAAYAIPAGVFTALVSGVFAAIALAVNGQFGGMVGALITALPSAAISGAIGGVVGFFAHPILEWIVRILKGESTPKSRSNFFLMTYTFTILTAIPSGIALVVAALPVPFISLLGPLLSLLVSLVGLLLYFLWFKHFRVHKAVQYIIMAFGVLAVLGAGWGFVSGLITQISNLGSGGNPGVVDTGELTDEQKALIEAAKTDPEAAAKLAEAQKMAAEAMAAAAAAGQEPDERTQKALEALRNKTAGVETPPPPADPESADDDDDDEDGEDVNALKAPPPPPPPARVEPPPPPARVEPPPPVEPPPAARVEPPPPPRRAAPTGPINTDEHPLGETDFVRFLAKRKAVEQAIEDDPSLVQRRDIRGDYETLWRVTYDIRDKYAKKYKKEDRWKREKIIGRQKDQEIFEKTRGEVDRLYAALFGGR